MFSMNGGSGSRDKMKKSFRIALSLFRCFILVTVVIASATATTVPTPQEDNSGGVVIDEIRVSKEGCTDLARDEETLMVFSTLGGGLTAIDPITSEIRWTIADDPPIRAEQQQNVQVPQYLPDPRDGSIYQLGDMGNLKKLPYTIPQLVANAPCRSSDGILYSGKKSDTWFIVDPKSGRREKVGFDGSMDGGGGGSANERIGWATSRAIYLGRTQYTVMMFDSLNKNKNSKPWNITFYDYSSMATTPDISKDYEYLHLTTTTNGNILTLDRKNGKFVWRNDLSSPVVAAFLLGPEGLLSVPFTTVSDEAFQAILDESKNGNVNTVKLFQSLYVGEHGNGLYALPSLVDKNTPRISTTPPIHLLGGPDTDEDPNTVYLNDVLKKNAGILLGYYNRPNDVNLQLSPSPTVTKDDGNHQLATISAALNGPGRSILSSDKTSSSASSDIGTQTEPVIELEIESEIPNKTFGRFALNKTKEIIIGNSKQVRSFIYEWFIDHPSNRVHVILCIIIIVMFMMFWYMHSSMRELRNQSENGSKTYSGSRGSGSSNISAQDLIDLGDGHIRVGKISFNSNEVLGKGCEGTFVFKGTFEERFVAVKRLLPECFTFADREVALLRESDAHENVVRYFCTEQDRQFRYIAVELCAATLQDYTEGERSEELRSHIKVWDVMKQAAAGLNHLHSLNIVHRDIKPQNVLLSLPDNNGIVRVMISDFGLCKKLNYGKTSFSRRSGVTGTDGWIAPEMMRGQRTTTSVDIFSLGCVYYYVLSRGQHLFGDALKRQANILTNDHSLHHLKPDSREECSKYILAAELISDMIHRDPQCRPPAKCIGNHPIFWTDKKILSFLQDVSDRVEKLQFNVEPLKSLEKNGNIVVLEDWNLHLDPVITEDLRKFRGYMGASVRDLLRALRNKKHHYHELTDEMQQILGSIPHEFTNYWISRFPYLISHAYHAFSICSNEPIFKSYYNSSYHFTRPEYFDADDDLYPTLLQRDPKPLAKQTATPGNASPKKVLTPQQLRQRKGNYNFRKSPGDGAQDMMTTTHGGLQRNFDVNYPTNEDENRDVFANFKFRRNIKSSNRNYNNLGKKDKNISWTLSPSNMPQSTDTMPKDE
ncbi:serine/threonine-protein kinase/endoribonuclease Ire1 [Haematobia irritans]|uniref:serine/threonine-protein kinase/endoribonuclease Ire1 n=1 Tax=Haematobia irritans TaxID=7368 RepID=UPI003F4F73AD